MTSIDFFYQGEGLQEIEHIEVGADYSFAGKRQLRVVLRLAW